MRFPGFSHYREVLIENKIKIYPFEDELLTSWIARRALGFGLTPYNLLKFEFGLPRLSILDYDRYISERNLQRLAEVSNLPVYALNQLTIIRYAEKIIDTSGNQKQHLYKDILPKSKSQKASMTYCPDCLKERKYFKIDWRLTLQVGCLKHNTLLRNTCPHCGVPVRLELINALLRDVTYCYACWRSLCSIKSEPLPSEIFPILESLKDGINNGWVVMSGNRQMMAPVFFQGIWKLLNMLYSNRNNIDYFIKSLDYFGLNNTNKISSNNHWNRFSNESIETKVFCLRLIAKMLEDWPQSFIDYCTAIGITKSVINPHNTHSPYWLHEVSVNEIFHSPYWVSDEEIKSVLKYMIDHGIKITRMGMAKLLGNDESMKLSGHRKEILYKFQRMQKEKIHN